MTTITKQQLCSRAADASGLSLPVVSKALDAIIGQMTLAFASGQGVSLRGFATFQCAVSSPRVARDIRRGVPVAVPPARKVKMRPSAQLSKAINPYK